MCDSVTATVLATSTSSSLQSCWIVYTNNQGTERLVVTRRNNGPPIDSNLPCTTAPSGTVATSKLSAGSGSFSTTSHITNTSSGGSGGGVLNVSMDAAAVNSTSKTVTSSTSTTTSTTTTEAALDYKSLNSILDDNLRPLTPIVGNPRSEQIHNEHEQLVQEYWEIQTQIVTSQARRDNLQANMPPEELRAKKEYLKKLEEKEALLKFKANLQKQLDERKRRAGAGQLQSSQLQQSAPPPSSTPAGSPANVLQRQDSTSESGWVIISKDENTGGGGNNPS